VVFFIFGLITNPFFAYFRFFGSIFSHRQQRKSKGKRKNFSWIEVCITKL